MQVIFSNFPFKIQSCKDDENKIKDNCEVLGLSNDDDDGREVMVVVSD